jgi:poly(3-hydroxybutyrate) depolymerase
VVPAATGTCPDFTNGEVTFSPAGIASRSVRLWVGEQGGGPLVFYWHGTGSSPIEASYGLSATAIAEIRALGGVVAAPTHDPEAGQWPWFLVAGTRIDDLVLADEIAACAVQKKQIDVRRIHVAGMSAGGLQTSQMSLRRSSYVASVAPYSGGLVPYANPPYEEPANHFPALIYWGGTDDVVVISFETASLNYSERLRANENFTVLCNHGQGHTIPADGGVTTWRFFQDHPFGTVPSPYADGLPSAFPAYCGL